MARADTSRMPPTVAVTHLDDPWPPPTARRAPVRDAARPLLIAALRRVFALGVDGIQEEEHLLNACKPSALQVAHAVSWHAAHPQGARPFLHTLRHAAWVLRAFDVWPSEVHLVRRAYGLPQQAEDQVLLATARAAQVTRGSGLTEADLVDLYEHEWTLDVLTLWCQEFEGASARHLRACQMAGFGLSELRRLCSAGELPSVTQVEFLAAMKRAPAAA